MKKIILIALAIVGTLEVNYQQRCLYYSQSDFVCVNQKAIDQIILNVHANGKQLIREKVWGATVCADYLRPENIIVSGNVWGIANVQENTFIKIRDQTNFMALKDWIYRIVQNSTIKDVSTIKGQKYNCQIVGDQTVKHYGVGIRGQKDCEYNIDCVKIEEEIAQE